MAATIKDIARETGLGYATISAYLNGTNVRPKNKELIEAAIQKLGYVRNEYARGLKTHRSMTIGVLIPELSNTFSTLIVSEMEDELRRMGMASWYVIAGAIPKSRKHPCAFWNRRWLMA